MFLISEVVEAVKACSITLQGFGEVEIMMEGEDNPILFVGGSAVVFRVRCDERECAMRCYTLPKPYLREIYGDRFIPKAIEIYSLGVSKWIDVVLCDWIEGEVLSVVVRRALREGDRELLSRLSHSFNRLALDMLHRTEWAHGDLSLRNIIVDKSLTMHLIDNDSNYVATLKGKESAEIGTPAFQSPLRSNTLFCPDMDDFSIAIISVALRALSLDPSLNDRHPLEDGLLINGTRVLDGRYQPLKEVTEMLAQRGEFATYRLARALSRHELHIASIAELIEFEVGLRAANAVNVEGTELFERMGVWGFHLLSSGEVTTPPLFDEAFEYRGNEALVRIVRWWFYIDRTGGVVASAGEWLNGKPPVVRRDSIKG